jgi:thiol-disulfide isomerase/thioredoxin
MESATRKAAHFITMAFCALIAVGALACGHYEAKYDGESIDATASGDDDADAGDDDGAAGIVQNGEPLPNYNWMDAQGETISLSDLKGDVLLLNVGAGWCLPCRDEAPLLESDIYQRFRDEGFEIIELLVEDEEGDDPTLDFLQAWRDEFSLSYYVCADPNKNGSTFGTLEEFFTEDSLPFSLFVDRNLVPQFRSHGYEKDSYIMLIESLL